MKNKKYYFFILYLTLLEFILVVSSGCNPTRRLQEKQFLLNSNTIKVNYPANVRKKSDLNYNLSLMPRPVPNKKFLFTYRARLGLYNAFYNTTEKQSLRYWLRSTVGEEPVLLDSLAMQNSAKKMTNYAFNKGYFNTKVNTKVTLKNKKAAVSYTVNVGMPYMIKSIDYEIDSSDHKTKKLFAEKMQEQDERFVKVGQQFSIDNLQAEIKRITTFYRNKGAYDFEAQYVTFEVDSTNEDHMVNLYLKIKTPTGKVAHQYYKIKNVYIYPEIDPTKDKLDDIVSLNQKYTKDIEIKESQIHVKTAALNQFNALTLARLSEIKGEQNYTQQTSDYTLQHFSDLSIFKAVSIRYEKESDNYLNCYIFLEPTLPMQLNFELELKNSQNIANNVATRSLFGAALSLGIKHKNILRGGEVFDFNINTGFEFVNLFNAKLTNTGLLNAFDVKTGASLNIPHFIPFYNFKYGNGQYRPHTVISTNYHYSQRLGFYTRNALNFSYGYDIRGSRIRYQINPIMVTFSNLASTTDTFQNILDSRPALSISFGDRAIIGGSVTHSYTNKNINYNTDFVYMRNTLELAGNTLYGFEQALKGAGAINKQNNLTILGLEYSQYVRMDGDWRYYHYINKEQMFIGRLAGGLGIPFGNSALLPYDKLFFLGGANSLRAFNIRTIGPGNYGETQQPNSISQFERVGNLKLEGNIEYRFSIISWIKGAFFVDAGNIWTIKSGNNNNDIIGFEQSRFKFNTFLSQIALGTGMGIRLDYSYFVLRFDLGVPLKSPILPTTNKWYFKQLNSTNDLVLNFAIGYPF